MHPDKMFFVPNLQYYSTVIKKEHRGVIIYLDILTFVCYIMPRRNYSL